ncbi:Probable enoyl-CoA hydratase echA8 [Achromobacter denitrificans]|uniref:crotonase/enoyl-CoA hydratase family protein n=1 Tax=Achromobacter denitrificans TaxID=32002 RepID=UPI000786B945|nr:crotonase/enoyl-CoA hydratase family protein [Achromobacter denitrificans]OLU08223.1 enoyl-CoA hydratase [Achromobacter denitrificans]QKH42602.1 crotonase/enoyl-CoA hydratase family protein [Achromobacter denitrificans]QKH50255.1 crotonase/enoyl-CoA hydratase family protein [Achromobacter denitrificans]CAB3678213.1 Short-chain-enoyl-CoA hydratase [Achromobacter denitrificans]SUU19500.1 Probable enoyl-CoA hydratase echA8 [Achromobacter denitrificans]
MTDFLKRERHGAVLLLTMDRGATRNALSDPDAIDALVDACAEINTDMSVRAVVLTGAHGVFSSGGNLKTLSTAVGAGLGEPVQSRLAYRNGIQRVPLALCNLEVPTIAAVNGPAIGAGCDLACMCDIRIAADEARFAESFVKLGLTPGDGGAWLLPRAVGMSRACEMAFTGRSVDAVQALDMGLVSQVVGREALLPAAMALAQEIAQHSGHALRLTKRLLREGQHTRLDTLLELSAGFQALAHHTQEHAAALDAFLDKTRG